jgi:hypothetical protein
MNTDNILAAMKADGIPEGWSGRWFVKKLIIPKALSGTRNEKQETVLPGIYTFLRCLTDATLYNDQPGEVVMEDTPFELRTHLGFILRARGKVLVTGLGLGCVVRGLLANPAVEHVTCIENSRDVLALVSPHMPKEKLTLIHADALEWTANNLEKFDCAWHDLWTNPEQGEPHLDIWHARLILNCRDTVKRQGAWAFERTFKRQLKQHGLHWIG